MNEGLIKGHKSVNVPNVHINLPAVTEKRQAFHTVGDKGRH